MAKQEKTFFQGEIKHFHVMMNYFHHRGIHVAWTRLSQSSGCESLVKTQRAGPLAHGRAQTKPNPELNEENRSHHQTFQT
jgi:hypothetical protein